MNLQQRRLMLMLRASTTEGDDDTEMTVTRGEVTAVLDLLQVADQALNVALTTLQTINTITARKYQ